MLKKGDCFKKDFKITSDLIRSFCSVTGDYNPLHTDDGYAKSMSFERIIAPGFLLGGLIASMLGNDFPGPGTLYISQTMKFQFPVYVNEIVSIELEIIEIKRNNWLVIMTRCIKQNNTVALTGEAVVMSNKINLKDITNI